MLVEISDLPLKLIGSLESLQFDLYDRNVFYAIGSTNELFTEDADAANTGSIKPNESELQDG